MADKRKNDKQPDDPKGKGKRSPEPYPNLELPPTHQHDDMDEPIEVVEVVEDELEVVEVVEDLQAVEVVEELEPEVVEVVDDDVVEEVVEVVDEEPSAVPKAPIAHVAAPVPVPAMPAGGHHKAEISDDDIDFTDVVEVLPSSSNVMHSLLVEEAHAEVVEEAQAEAVEEALGGSEVIKSALAMPPAPDSGKIAGKPHGAGPEDVGLEYDDVIVEGESEIDIGKKAGAKGERPSGVDIIAEALESGVDLAQTKPHTPPAAKKTGSESDIDLESILGDSGESSAVDLGSSGQQRALSASETSGSEQHAVGEGDIFHGVEDTDDEIAAIGENDLLDSTETEAMPGDDDAELVLPKKKIVVDEEELAVVSEAATDEEAIVGAAAAAAPTKKGRGKAKELVGAGGGGGRRRGGFLPFMFGGLLAVVLSAGGAAAAWYLNLLPESPSAPKKVGGKSMSPPAHAAAVSDAQKARELIDKGDYMAALDLVKDADANSPEGAIKGLATFKKLEAGSKAVLKADNPEVVKALGLMDGGGAKAAADDIRKKLGLQAELAALSQGAGKDVGLRKERDFEKNRADALENTQKIQQKELADAIKAKQVAEGKLKDVDKDSAGSAAKIAELTAARDAAASAEAKLNLAIEAALKELKDGNYLGGDSDPLKQLVEGTKKARASGQSPLGSSINGLLGAFGGMGKAPGDVFKKALDAAKLSTDLAAAKAENVFAETPDHRCDTIISLLGNRGYTDPKELESFKHYIEWIRAKDSKASPELKAKALYIEALVQRNQENFAGARLTLEQAVKEAQALKDAAALQTATAQSLKELTDPASYFRPRGDSMAGGGKVKDAVEELNAGLKAFPDNPQLLLKRAQVTLETAMAAGKMDGAVQKHIRDDAELASKDPTAAAEAFYLIGRLEEFYRDWPRAENNYRAAAKLAGTGEQSDRFRAALARVLQRSGLDETPQPEAQDDEAMQVAEIAFVDEDGQDDSASRKRLEESLKIAEELIAKQDPKVQGEGYMIKGAAQAKLGQMTEGLKNFVKGLKLTNPDWSTNELDRIITNHPAFQQPDFALQPNPLMADKHFGLGLDLFWARNYAGAETEFVKAIGFYDDDARYRYFLGMSRQLQGTKDKMKLAQTDFERGVQLELSRHPSTREVNASLERVQGDLRKLLNAYRERPQ